MTRSPRLPPFPVVARHAIAVTAAVILTGGQAVAQDPVGAAVKQADGISRRFSEDVRQFEEKTSRTVRQAPGGIAAGPELVGGDGESGQCVAVNRIAVSGVTLLPQLDLQKTVSEWQGRCLRLSDLNAVLQKITFLYINRDYVASRAYLPEQDLSTGTLTVNVIEGRLQDIIVKQGRAAGGQLLTAFPGLKGRPLNLRAVEQGLDQINRLRSVKATISLEAGAEQGDSVLGVTLQRQKPWALSIGADNSGTPLTGIYQSRADLGVDNVLGLNDQWSVNYQRSMARHPLFMSEDPSTSNLVALAASIPYGAWLFGVDSSWSSYRSSVRGQISDIDTSGSSESVSPYASVIFSRDQISKTWLSGRLTRKSTENFLLGSRLDSASRTLAVASMEIGHSRQLLGGEASVSIEYRRGLNILGAVDDATAAVGSPKAQYDMLAYSLGYVRSQDIDAFTGIFRTSLSGQWTDDPLFASEQMAFGGNSTVRGVRDALLSSSTGVLWRNELSMLLPPPEEDGLAQAFGRLESYMAVDVGHARANAEDGSIGGTMTGGTVGLRNRGGQLNFDIFYSRVLSISGARRPDDGLVQARLAIQF